MKKEYSNLPKSLVNLETYGFSWMDFVTAIPSPLIVVTTYKDNGKTNACLQSWVTFSGNTNGFYAILSSVSKYGHMYTSIKKTGVAVINFPSKDIYDKCYETIRNNQYEKDEIESSGLTAEPSSLIDAPRIKECFLNLECKYLWEKEIKEGDGSVLMCMEILNICGDEAHLDESLNGRYGHGGFLYNIHYPISPENFKGKSHDWIGTLIKEREMGEY